MKKNRIYHGYLRNASLLHLFAALANFFFAVPFLNWVYGRLEWDTSTLTGSYVLPVSIGLYLIGLHIKEDKNSSDLSQNIVNLEDTVESIRTSPKVERYRTLSEVNLHLKQRMGRAVEIKNTFFPNENHRSGESIINPDAIELFRLWLINPHQGQWSDLVGPEEIFDDRFYQKGRSPVAKIKTQVVSVLRHGSTCPNMMLITYDDDTQEVFWGWLSESHDSVSSKVPYVMSSRNLELFNYYNDMFDLLKKRDSWGNSIVLEHLPGTDRPQIARTEVTDKVGFWSSLSVNNGEIQTLGVYRIFLELDNSGRRRFKMTGLTYNPDLVVFEVAEHEQDQVYHHGSRLFIEYGLGSSGGRKGLVFYDFSDKNGQLYGFFSNEDDEKKNRIAGIKVEPLDLPIMKIGDKISKELAASFILTLNALNATRDLQTLGVTPSKLQNLVNSLNKV